MLWDWFSVFCTLSLLTEIYYTTRHIISFTSLQSFQPFDFSDWLKALLFMRSYPDTLLFNCLLDFVLIISCLSVLLYEYFIVIMNVLVDFLFRPHKFFCFDWLIDWLIDWLLLFELQWVRVSDDGVIVVARYVAGSTKQQWLIEKDEIRSKYGDRQLSVGVEGRLMPGARCLASVSSSNNCWLFDHQWVSNTVSLQITSVAALWSHRPPCVGAAL